MACCDLAAEFSDAIVELCVHPLSGFILKATCSFGFVIFTSKWLCVPLVFSDFSMILVAVASRREIFKIDPEQLGEIFSEKLVSSSRNKNSFLLRRSIFHKSGSNSGLSA